MRDGDTRRRLHVVVSCEHGGNRIPARYARWFAAAQPLLASHRGYDPGALALARVLAARLHAPLHFTTLSRLLVEQNRGLGHAQLFSAMMRAAPDAVRAEVLERHYAPYHAAVEAEVARAIAGGARVLHISSHSFTPVLDGAARTTDIGLLYDPSRAQELEFCALLQAALGARTRLRVRRNYPYRGTSDGLVTALRRRFAEAQYAGMELEVNQRFVQQGGAAWRAVLRDVAAAMADAVAAFADATPPCDGRESAPRSPAATKGRFPRAATRAGR